MFKKLVVFASLLFAAHAVTAQNLKMFVTLNPAGDFVAENDQITGKAFENADGSVEASNVKLAVKAFKTGISLRDNHLVDKYLEAEKHPEILLRAAKGRNGKGEAILVVKGKAAKVSGTYMKGKDKLKAIFNAKISDFGITDISYKGIGVEDEVKIEVILPLEKKTAQAPAAQSTKPVAKPPAKDKK